MTTQPENEAGDQTDRMVDYIGGRPTPRNAGFYGEYLPQQRYAMYQVAYWTTAEDLAQGRISEIPDEIVLLMAWAAVDKEAVDSFEVEMEGNPGYQYLHEQVFGSAKEWFGADFGYQEAGVWLPKIDQADPERYFHFVEEAFEEAEGPRSTYDFYGKQPGFFDIGTSVMQWLGRNVSLDENTEEWGDSGPNTGGLFNEAAEESRPPGENEFEQFTDNVANTAVPFAVDVWAGLSAAKIIGGSVGAALTASASTLQGTGTGAAIASGLAKVGQGVSWGFRNRRRIALGQAMFGAVIGGQDYLSARFSAEPTKFQGEPSVSEEDKNLLTEMYGSMMEKGSSQPEVLDAMYPQGGGDLSRSWQTTQQEAF